MLTLIQLLLTVHGAFAQTPAPTSTTLMCPYVTPIELRYLQRHVNYSELTPELQEHTVAQFIKHMDERKLYLLDGDVNKIHQNLHKIFSQLSLPDCAPLMKAEDLYVKRVEERVAYAKRYLGRKFKLDGKMLFKPDVKNRAYPKDTRTAQTAMRAEIQAAVANYVASGISVDNAKKHVLQSFDRLLLHVHELKPQNVYTDYLAAYALALDPHSSYMSAEELEDFEIQMRLSLDGIGAQLVWKDGFTTVVHLVPGGAAATSGLLKKGDKIVGVAQDQGAFVDTMEMELRDVIKLIRGPKGTALRLKVLRQVAGDTKTIEVPLVRDKVKLEEQAAAIHFVDRDVDGQKLKVGVLNLPSFYHDDRRGGRSATSDMKKLLAEAVRNKADALVLDLANDGGGSLPDAVDVAGLFLAKADIVRLGERGRQPGLGMDFETLTDTDSTVNWPGPLVILTNRGSASASEIVSGALQDYHRAVIVGDGRTFGKGTMQAVENLNPGLGAVKTTTGMFFTAGGQSTQHRGVSSDIVLPSDGSLDVYSETALDYSLPPKKIEPFLSASANSKDSDDTWTPITEAILKALKLKSSPRVTADKDFQKLLVERKKNKKSVNVTIASLLKGKDPSAAKGDDDDKDLDPTLTPAEKTKKYLERPDVREAASIAADLALELRALKTRNPSSQQAGN